MKLRVTTMNHCTNDDIMSIRIDDFFAKLPADRQEAIRKRAAELIAEEARTRPPRQVLVAKDRPQE
jgi:TRAP-type C4-dicarboxylate transport system substrate-binding protein